MWVTIAYGFWWKAKTFEGLVRMIDRYAEQHDLRAVSIVADWED